MSQIWPAIDPDGLTEYSVVFSDRSLNHMSAAFRGVMTGLHAQLTQVYNAHSCVFVPGGGTYAMEAVARQFATGEKVLVVRNGWFSFRWTQIFDTGSIPSHAEVACATPDSDAADQQFSPVAADVLAQRIREERPALVVAPHVETSAGMILPDETLATLGAAARDVGALFVLDCIASGAMWVDMEALGIDVLLTAPQKGWSSTPCAGIVLLSERAEARLAETQSSSFSLDLAKWHSIMAAYLAGGHAYHATMPTDGLATLHATVQQMSEVGFPTLRERQQALGDRVRRLLEAHGFKSVAAPGFQAPSVIVSHTTRDDIKNGAAFAAAGLQVAGGVPLRCGESDAFKTFRIGLFGLDKLQDPDRTVALLEAALQRIAPVD